ncbi:MAG TPA: hypothetical protein PL045_03095, partial [Chitinophagaceae bacterium]|nr:hypothetical protein [Chitinophagaceae bacterium]
MIALINIVDKKIMIRIFLLVVSFGVCKNSFTQNAAARYEIDAKRIGVNPTSKDALPRSREFIRLDSTYYVGWMYEGMYKFERSADYLGYKNAIVPLRKSFDLLNKDFEKNFRQLFNDVNTLIHYYPRYQDLLQIFYSLQECYSNIEMPDSVINIITKLQAYNFKNDAGFDLCSRMAWTYHRSRFLKSNQFSYSKNSVQENEKMAFQWCYNGFAYIDKYKEFNDATFGPYYSEQ